MYQFDENFFQTFNLAQNEAVKQRHSEVTPLHLLWAFGKNPKSHYYGSLKEFMSDIAKRIEKLSRLSLKQNDLKPSKELSQWISTAAALATQTGQSQIEEKHFSSLIIENFPEYPLILSGSDQQSVPDFLINLNELAEKGKLDPVIGRESEIRSLMEILGRRSKNNPVLIGSAGVGKTAIVEGLANAIHSGEASDIIKDKVIYSLNMGDLMAGTQYRGSFEKKLKELVGFLKEQNHQAILFIDELHLIVGAGKTDGAMDAANLLKPALARGDLNCIGATTEDEYKKYILSDNALDRRFRPVKVKEPTPEESIEILLGIKEKFEMHHGIKISDDAVFAAVFLSNQYINLKQLPDKAIDLIDEASSSIKIEAQSLPTELIELQKEIRAAKTLSKVEKENTEVLKEIEKMETKFKQQESKWKEKSTTLKEISYLKNELDRLKFLLQKEERVQNYEEASKIKYSLIPKIEEKIKEHGSILTLTPKEVAKIIHRQTGVPLEKILMEKQEHILGLENFLNSRVIGQKKSAKEIADTLMTSFAGLKDDTKPLGSFLLMGPTGVGKTETVKSVSSFLFESSKNIVRFDLSEFSEKHSVSKLIGSPAGYVGYDDSGVLTEAIRKNPYSVILFDEVEKAHSDFSDILLQILDDGRLTDNKGRTIDFKNTIIFLTTNSQRIEDDFKPEVLGRLDSIIEYKDLSRETFLALIQKEVQMLNERLKTRKLEISLTDKAKAELANLSSISRFGARPLKNLFNKEITKPISRFILQGAGIFGKIIVDLTKDGFSFELPERG